MADLNKKIKITKKHVKRIVISVLCLFMIAAGACKIYETSKYSVYVYLLKTGSSLLEQGFKNSMGDSSVTHVTDTPIWHACNIKDVDKNPDGCKAQLSRYFTGIRAYTKKYKSKDKVNTYNDRVICKRLVGRSNMWWHLNSRNECSGWDNYTFYFNNGMKADALLIGQNDSYLAGQITIDVNGDKPPNRWGRDTYMFNILDDGTLIPYAGLVDCEKLARYTNNEVSYVLSNRHWKYTNVCSFTTKEDGTACGARIIESGWKMDY